MDVRRRSVLFLSLGILSGRAQASGFHESLQAGVICSSEHYPLKFEILEPPATEDGFFKVSDGLCRAIPIDSDDGSTSFPVAYCINSNGTEFTLFFGGWLNMLTAQFTDQTNENQQLFCK